MSICTRLFRVAAAACLAGAWAAGAAASPIVFLGSNAEAEVAADSGNGPSEFDSISTVDLAFFDAFLSVESHDDFDDSLFSSASANIYFDVASNVVVANGFNNVVCWGSPTEFYTGKAYSRSTFQLAFALDALSFLQGGALLFSNLQDGLVRLEWSLEGSGGPLYGEVIEGQDYSFTPIAFILPAGAYSLSAFVYAETELNGGVYSGAFGSWSIDFIATPIPEPSAALLAAAGAACLAVCPRVRRMRRGWRRGPTQAAPREGAAAGSGLA